jgi:hypothetical protein
VGPTDEHGNVTIDSFVARGISACEDVIETADLETKSFAVDELLHVSYSATAFCYAGFDSGGYELSGELAAMGGVGICPTGQMIYSVTGEQL